MVFARPTSLYDNYHDYLNYHKHHNKYNDHDHDYNHDHNFDHNFDHNHCHNYDHEYQYEYKGYNYNNSSARHKCGGRRTAGWRRARREGAGDGIRCASCDVCCWSLFRPLVHAFGKISQVSLHGTARRIEQTPILSKQP
mmetsp:Transcript_108816/g.192450  ORF Transcript_108816/g.192450 Transcript_108816/m.192450 type:complete len:139 (-) Transcript_108816:181-597(-)